jgi:hypothetical protein
MYSAARLSRELTASVIATVPVRTPSPAKEGDAIPTRPNDSTAAATLLLIFPCAFCCIVAIVACQLRADAEARTARARRNSIAIRGAERRRRRGREVKKALIKCRVQKCDQRGADDGYNG